MGTKIIKRISIISVIVMLFFSFLTACSDKQPEEVHIEASELNSILYSEKLDEYFGDDLYVHGYLIRDEEMEEEHSYILAGDKNDTEGLIFSCEEALEEDLGTGSELIVKGTLSREEGESAVTLVSTEIEVKEKILPIYEFKSVTALLKSANDVVNKRVCVKGTVDNDSSDENKFNLMNGDGSKVIALSDLSDKQKEDLTYGTYKITGKFYLKDGKATIDVEKTKLIKKKTKKTQEKVAKEIPYFDTVKELYALASMYIGKTVSVQGYIDGAGDSVFLSEDGIYIELTGLTQEEGMSIYGGYSYLTGTLGYGVDNDYSLHVEKIGY